MEPVNILIVDDKSSDLEALQAALNDLSYCLVLVDSGENALRYLEKDKFALAILDIHMRGMNGFEVARQIRQTYYTGPLIFLTEMSDDIDKMATGYEVENVDYIYRPISQTILRAKVANLVALSRKTIQIAKQIQLLGKSEQVLEKLVEQRTRELQKSHDQIYVTNNRLREEVSERKRTEVKLRLQLERTEALYSVTRSLVGQMGLDDLLRTVVDSIAQTLPAHLIAIIILDMDAEEMIDSVLGGTRQDDWYPLSFEQLINGLPGEALRSMRPLLSRDGVNRPYPNDSGELCSDPGSVLVAPLQFQSAPYGVMMAINWGTDNHFSAQDLELLTAMATQAAVAIAHAGIFDDTLRTLNQVRRVIHSVPSGVVLLDAQYRILLKNPVADICIEAIGTIDDEDRLLKLGATPLAEFITPGESASRDAQLLSIKKRMFEVHARSLNDSFDKEQWVLVLRDITMEMVTLEHQLTQQRQAVVGQLAAGVAHDFNNILAVITLYCQLLQKMPEPEKVQQYLTIIHQQANRGAELISQLLDFGRQSLMKPRSIDLVPFLRDIVNLLSRTFPKNIALNFTTFVDTLYLHVDPTHLQQVFMNLAINARDAMTGDGQFQIWLESIDLGLHAPSPVPGMASGLWAKVLVSDTGNGMAAEVRNKIFEPFFTTKEPDQGTGLGLAQVYGIIQQLSGEITVSSVEGEGTTFIIYLPIKGLVSVPLLEDVRPKKIDVSYTDKTILLVEDESSVRAALQEMLANLGFDNVLVAANGQEALQYFRTNKGQIDLVLSDMVMPKMGGLELFEILRDEQPTIKMIISTGYSLEKDGDALRKRGIVDWVMKPFSIEEVSTKIYKALAA